MSRVHEHGEDLRRLAADVLAWSEQRLGPGPPPLGSPLTEGELRRAAGDTITPTGLGADAALAVFTEVLAPACVAVDHPRFLSFIPCAPAPAASLIELAVGASSIFGGTWLEGAGAVWAENEALRWLADLAGLPAAAGGTFVPGGTLGNLSALVAAREAARGRRGTPADRWTVAAGDQAHSSVAAVARVMDAHVLTIPSDREGRMGGEALRAVVERAGDGLFAVVATAGTTNFGIVDRLEEIADVCLDHSLWLHVDGAYGGAALAAPSVRHLFTGVERADSFVVDPHKWLFVPFDCCALLYRDPEPARRAHAQTAGYLEAVQTGDWNPCDYAVHLSRRARGLPFWFSLAAHGTDAYAQAIERTLGLARYAATEIRRRPYVELVRAPDLSVVVFRRPGWSPGDYREWSDRLWRDGHAFVVPTRHREETVTRFAFVNPRTTEADVTGILDTMA